jgi:hypothetical protein
MLQQTRGFASPARAGFAMSEEPFSVWIKSKSHATLQRPLPLPVQPSFVCVFA